LYAAHVKVSSKKQAHREAVLSIQMEPDEVEPYLQRAYQRIVQRTKIPGFRPGKAPRHIVEQIYGKEHLLQEALDFLVPEVTNRAMDESELEFAGVPSVTLDQMEPVTITATVPLVPTVDLGKYLSVRVSKQKVLVTEEQVNEVLERMREEVAPWEPVNAGAALDDLLNISVQGWANDKQLISQERADFTPRAGAHVPAPGFAEQVVGMKAQEAKEFTIEVPEDFEHSEVAGKSCRFQVTVHIVKRKKPGKLDNEFAKGIGDGYESLKLLKDRVQEDLAKERESAIISGHRDETLNKVLEGASIELSPIIVEHELDHMLEDHQEAMKSGRMTMEHYQHYLAWAGKSEEEIREESRPQAEQRIKRALVLREVADQQKLVVTDQDVIEEIEGAASGAGENAASIREMFESEDGQDSLRRLLVNRKAIDFLTETVGNRKAASTMLATKSGTVKRALKRAPANSKAKAAAAKKTK
jgi:trigger factor